MLDAVEETAAFTRKRILDIRQPYTKGQSLVDAGIAKRKTAAEYLKNLEKTGILTGKRVDREMLYLNTRLYDLLSK